MLNARKSDGTIAPLFLKTAQVEYNIRGNEHEKECSIARVGNFAVACRQSSLRYACAALLVLLTNGWITAALGAPEFDGGYIKTTDGRYLEIPISETYTTLVDNPNTTMADFASGRIPEYRYVTDLSESVEIKRSKFDGIAIKGRYDFQYVSIHAVKEMLVHGKDHGLAFNKGPAAEGRAFYVPGSDIPMRKKSTGSDSYYFVPRNKPANGYYLAWVGESFWIFRIRADDFRNKERLSRELIDAAHEGNMDRVGQLLSSGADAKFIGQGHGDSFGWGYTAMVAGVRAGHTEVVSALLEAGADANGRGSYRSSVLDEALKRDNDEVVQLLLDAGAEIRPRNSTLIAATIGGRADLVESLLERGADVNARAGYKGSSTPVSVASGAGNLEILRMLIAKGAKLNTSDSFCMTPLGLAAREGHVHTVKLLLKSGAATGAPTNCNSALTALEIASEAGQTDVVNLLEKHDAQEHDSSSGATQDDNTAKTLSAYHRKLQALLLPHKRYPEKSKRDREEGTVTVKFGIDRSGTLLLSQIAEGSGHYSLDRAALQMIQDARPFPPIPDNIDKEILLVTIPVAFKLR